jgi:lon-related putative ATP-dependent protease
MPLPPLTRSQLHQPCDPRQLPFTTTDELTDLCAIIGQQRAGEALRFGIGMTSPGYNLFVTGAHGMGKYTMVRQFLEQHAVTQPAPREWLYVHNFDQGHKPRALSLAPATAETLVTAIRQLIQELETALKREFNGESYRNQIQTIESLQQQREDLAFAELAQQAAAQQIKLLRNDEGIAFVPMDNDREPLTPAAWAALAHDDRHKIEEKIAHLQQQLQHIFSDLTAHQRNGEQQIARLNTQLATTTVAPHFSALQQRYADAAIDTYLQALQQDVIDHLPLFIAEKEDIAEEERPTRLARYRVNHFRFVRQRDGAPVVYLDNPNYLNLIGRAEYSSQSGNLVTDFSQLKPGALHEANGGYLLLDAHKLLTQPYAWEALKRSLTAGQIRIDSLERMLSLVSTITLEPEPIPLQIKIILFGDRATWYLLQEYDPDFGELFKVQADFADDIPRSDENHLQLARLLATLIRREGLRHADAGAVARIIDYAARQAEDATRLTAHMRSVTDLLREADWWAREAKAQLICAHHIQQAIDQQIYRSARVREEIEEAIARGEILITTHGHRIGQVNGLSVVQLGNQSFGQPSRITATVHIGDGNVVDIEREVDLGGPLHTKGVLILSSYLASRYARNFPLALSASLAFEQNYGGVEGDSASLAELCALMSAIGEIPLRQGIAMTGSVNQFGEVQPIGGVNEKIEGYFRLCEQRGLDGSHGVLIPACNRHHLMLNSHVVEAAAAGLFNIFAVSHVEEALELLSDLPIGSADSESGSYPEESLNGRIFQRLYTMSHIRATFADQAKGEESNDEPNGGE